MALDDSDLSDAMTVLEGVQKTEVEFLGTYFGGACDEGGHDSADHGSDATHHGQPCYHPGVLRGHVSWYWHISCKPPPPPIHTPSHTHMVTLQSPRRKGGGGASQLVVA